MAAAEGSTYDEINPILGPWKASTKWRVVEHEAPRRSVHRTGDIPLSRSFEVVMEVAPEGGASEVTITLRGEPAHGPAGASVREPDEGPGRPRQQELGGGVRGAGHQGAGRAAGSRVAGGATPSPRARGARNRVLARGATRAGMGARDARRRRDRGRARHDHRGPRRRRGGLTWALIRPGRALAAGGATRAGLGAAGALVQLHLGGRIRAGRTRAARPLVHPARVAAGLLELDRRPPLERACLAACARARERSA